MKKAVGTAFLWFCIFQHIHSYGAAKQSIQPLEKQDADVFLRVQKQVDKYLDLSLGILGSINNKNFNKELKEKIILHLATKKLTFQEQQLLENTLKLFQEYFEVNVERLEAEQKVYFEQRKKIHASFTDKFTEKNIPFKQFEEWAKERNQSLENIQKLPTLKRHEDLPKRIDERFTTQSAPLQSLGKSMDILALLEIYFNLLPLNPKQRTQLQPIKQLIKEGIAIDWKKGQQDIQLYQRLTDTINTDHATQMQKFISAKQKAQKARKATSEIEKQMEAARGKKRDQLARLPKPLAAAYAEKYQTESLYFFQGLRKASGMVQISPDSFQAFGKNVIEAGQEALRAMKSKK